MRHMNKWFEITYKADGIFKTVHHLAVDKERAERWGEDQYGKIYGVQKVSLDDLFRDKEKKYAQIVSNQQPLGLHIAKGVYESDFDLTKMLFGDRKKDPRVKMPEKFNRWERLAEAEK